MTIIILTSSILIVVLGILILFTGCPICFHKYKYIDKYNGYSFHKQCSKCKKIKLC